MSNKENTRWISISEAVSLFSISEMTARRFITKHKDSANVIKKNGNKNLINYDIFATSYEPTKEQQEQPDEQNDVILREFSDRQKEYNVLAKHNQNIIDELIKHRNDTKPLYRSAIRWTVLGFVILLLIAGAISWLYRAELINTYKSKLSETTEFKNQIIEQQNNTLKKTQKELATTKEAYIQTLKNVDILHVKFAEKIEAKDKQILKQQSIIDNLKLGLKKKI
jgi:hypothetical protein